MRIPDLCLQQPANLDAALAEAERAADQGGAEGFDWLGGGTDLLCNYKWRLNVRPTLIALRAVPELQAAAAGPLAAGRTLWDIEHDQDLARIAPEIPRVAGLVASPLIRRTATLGGNLHLDTRCWHFNQTAEWRAAHHSCLKAEADQCRVMPDPGDVCVATYSGDLAPVLMAYGVHLELASAEGRRQVALCDHYAADGIRRFADLRPNELMVAAHLPADVGDWTVRYQKLRLRQTFDFPEGGVAIGLKWADRRGGKIAAARVATTAYASVPQRHAEIESLLVGQKVTEELAERAATSLQAEIRPMKNTSMSPLYRRKMARVLFRRALFACLPADSA